jgi:hypothetical protein
MKRMARKQQQKQEIITLNQLALQLHMHSTEYKTVLVSKAVW